MHYTIPPLRKPKFMDVNRDGTPRTPPSVNLSVVIPPLREPETLPHDHDFSGEPRYSFEPGDGSFEKAVKCLHCGTYSVTWPAN